MAPADAGGMDAVIFYAKAAHLAAQRAGRRLLRRFGITPARFDLMHALGERGMKQSDLWRRLNVVRSAISEMVGALVALGWVRRSRDADRRTWLVQLTASGRARLDRAYAECVESGCATFLMDAAVTRGHVELDALKTREELISTCRAVDEMFRVTPWFHGPSLYEWDPADYWVWLTDPNHRTDGEDVPFVDELGSA